MKKEKTARFHIYKVSWKCTHLDTPGFPFANDRLTCSLPPFALLMIPLLVAVLGSREEAPLVPRGSTRFRSTT